MVFPRQRRGIPQCLFRAGVNGVRRHGGMNKRITLPLLDELFAVRRHLGFALIVRGREVDPRFAKESAQPGRFCFLGNGIFKVVHVRERGGAAANHLRHRQPRAPADVIFGDVAGLGRENVLAQPVIQRDIVDQPAHQHHRHMRVAVDESRQDQFSFRVYGLLGEDSFRKGHSSVGAHGNDGVAFHRNETVLDDLAIRIHRDDRASRYQQVHRYWLFGRRLCIQRGAATRTHNRIRSSGGWKNENIVSNASP